MKQSLFTRIALSSVVLATGTLGIPVNAKTAISSANLNSQVLSTTTPTYIAQSTNPFASIEQAVHAQINQYRQQHGLSLLTIDERISNIARTHSQNMASKAVPFSHDGFQARVQTIGTMIPYRAAAENVAYNMGYSDPATKAVQGWLNSQGHRQNIEGNYNITGIGVAKNAKGEYYFTQIFIRSR